MKISNIVKTAALSTIALVSCSRGPLHRVEARTPITHVVDSLHNATKAVANDTSLTCFYKDTVQVSPKDFKNPEKFMRRLEKDAKFNIPQDTTAESNTGDMTVTSGGGMGISMGGGMAMGMDGHMHIDMSGGTTNDYTDKINENTVKAVVGEGVYTDTKGKSLYIPIAGYGKEIH